MKLHLVNDEKIINRTIDIFEEVFPGQNLFVVTNRRRQADFKLVRRGCSNVLSGDEFMKCRGHYRFREVYIHWLDVRKMAVVDSLGLSAGTKVYWIIWGLDLYNRLLAPKGFRLLDEATSSYYRQLHSGWKALELPFREWRRRQVARKTVKFVHDRVDCIVTDTTENDYDYLVRYYPQLAGKPWKDFFYYPLDVILGPGLLGSRVNGRNIMIGHSASVTNNHEQLMGLLSRLDVGQRKVIMPLSYAGKKHYVAAVLAAGRRLLGDNFCPLLRFLPLEEYNRVQCGISVALFGNLRQEAIGNIIVALYLGAKVFLPAGAPVYEWAQRHGLTVFALDGLTQDALDTPLDAAAALANRKILAALYNKERMLELIRQLPG